MKSKLRNDQKRAIIDAQNYIYASNKDSAARLISFVIRSAMRQTQIEELMRYARFAGLTDHPEFKA